MTVITEEFVPVSRAGTLYDVLELILDRGIVIDVFVRVSLVGIEIIKIDARIVVASVDTYLRFAEACNRVDLTNDSSSRTVPELFGGGVGGSVGRVGAKKAAHSVGEKVRGVLGGESEGQGRPRRRSGSRDEGARPRSRRREESHAR